MPDDLIVRFSDPDADVLHRERWVLTIPGRPTTLNAERQGARHWSKTREQTRDVRRTAAILAMQAKVPALELIAVTARPILRDKRTQDVGACFPTVKAAIDGLVDAGILPDDTPEHLAWLTFEAPQVGAGFDALQLTVWNLG